MIPLYQHAIYKRLNFVHTPVISQMLFLQLLFKNRWVLQSVSECLLCKFNSNPPSMLQHLLSIKTGIYKQWLGLSAQVSDSQIFPFQLPVKLLQTYLDMQSTQLQLHWCGMLLLLRTKMVFYVTTLCLFWSWILGKQMCTPLVPLSWIFRDSTHTTPILVWLLLSLSGLDHSPNLSLSSLLKMVIYICYGCCKFLLDIILYLLKMVLVFYAIPNYIIKSTNARKSQYSLLLVTLGFGDILLILFLL